MARLPHRLLAITAATGLVLTTTAWPGSAQRTHAKRMTIAFVPKLINIDYFNSMRDAGVQAGKDMGFDFVYEGPTEADAAAQVRFIRQLIAQHVDAIIVAPDDPAVVAPALQSAEAQGIKTLTADTDAPNTVRRVFVNQGLDSEIGGDTIDILAKAMGGKGDWAIDSCGPAAQNLNSWIAVEEARAKRMYPKLHEIAKIYSGENTAKSVADTKDLITTHPTLRGIIGQCGLSAPAVAQAVTDLHKVGKIAATGVSWPKLMKPYVKNGSSPGFAWWDVYNLGYAAAWAARELVMGHTFKAHNMVPKVWDMPYDPAKKQLILGHLIKWDKSNIDQASPMGHKG
jgi:rhamnose transport system substrate-binding protein